MKKVLIFLLQYGGLYVIMFSSACGTTAASTRDLKTLSKE